VALGSTQDQRENWTYLDSRVNGDPIDVTEELERLRGGRKLYYALATVQNSGWIIMDLLMLTVVLRLMKTWTTNSPAHSWILHREINSEMPVHGPTHSISTSRVLHGWPQEVPEWDIPVP
jgi:hypothetical protein